MIFGFAWTISKSSLIFSRRFGAVDQVYQRKTHHHRWHSKLGTRQVHQIVLAGQALQGALQDHSAQEYQEDLLVPKVQ